MGAERRHGEIVLVIFGQVGLDVGNIRNLELVGVVEEHRWSDDGVDLLYQDLLHHFQFDNASRKVRRDSCARG